MIAALRADNENCLLLCKKREYEVFKDGFMQHFITIRM